MYGMIRRDTLIDFQEVLQNMQEFKAMAKSNNIQNNILADNLEQLENDMYFDTMQESVVEIHEKFLDIYHDPSETLPFRRERVKSRYNLKPPFSRPYMKEKLDLIIGKGKYSLNINCLNKSITVEASMEDKPFFEELYVTFNLIKPCTMIFITKPYTVCSIEVSNGIETANVQFHKLDGTKKLDGWRLGNTGDYKEVSNLTNLNNLVNDIAECEKNRIAKILINNVLEINDFSKAVSNGEVELTYLVDSSIGEINNIKILKADGSLLTESTVYVPNVANMQFKQRISIREGR